MPDASSMTGRGSWPDGGYRAPSVRLDAYDPSWPQRYRREASSLAQALGEDLLAIEHIGSTSVPDMPAKPTIDIVADIADRGGFEGVVECLTSIGYLYTPGAERDTAERKVFRKGPSDMARPREFHLHICPEGCYYWRRIVAFRDQLRAHPDIAAEYLALKRELAERFADAPGRYTHATPSSSWALSRGLEFRP